MLKYSLRRMFYSLLTIFVLVTATFFLMKLMPGDPFQNDDLPVEVQMRQKAYYGLDKPVIVQYLSYMKNLLRGDMGTSLKNYGREVTSYIKEGFPVSATLGLAAFFVSQLVAWPLAILVSQFRNKAPDYIVVMLAVAGIALPTMVIGPILRYVLGVKLKVLPVTGWGDWKHFVMPIMVMLFESVGMSVRSQRANMLNVSTQDYMKTARAKGMHPFKVIMKHQVRNASVPWVTGIPARIASLMMGSFVIENIFVIPGMGKHLVTAINSLDYPVIMGMTVFYGTFLVFMNFLSDLLYGVVDPRIRIA